MDLTVDLYYVGLITGVVVGWTLSAITNLVFTNTRPSVGVEKRRANAFEKKEEYKMALLVRQDLKMSKGIVAAQCLRASLHCYEKGLKLHSEKISSWESHNKPMDVFKVANEMLMLKYHELADELGHNTYKMMYTEASPCFNTVLAIGPDTSCAVVSVIAYNKNKLKGLPSKCARIVLRAPDLKTIDCIKKQCKLFDISTATFTENNQVTVLAIGPAYVSSINAQVQNLKLY